MEFIVSTGEDNLSSSFKTNEKFLIMFDNGKKIDFKVLAARDDGITLIALSKAVPEDIIEENIEQVFRRLTIGEDCVSVSAELLDDTFVVKSDDDKYWFDFRIKK